MIMIEPGHRAACHVVTEELSHAATT
jgi:hypothetical protein